MRWVLKNTQVWRSVFTRVYDRDKPYSLTEICTVCWRVYSACALLSIPNTHMHAQYICRRSTYDIHIRRISARHFLEPQTGDAAPSYPQAVAHIYTTRASMLTCKPTHRRSFDFGLVVFFLFVFFFLKLFWFKKKKENKNGFVPADFARLSSINIATVTNARRLFFHMSRLAAFAYDVIYINIIFRD